MNKTRSLLFRMGTVLVLVGICVWVITALHLWKKQTLLSVAAGTLCYMLLVQFVF